MLAIPNMKQPIKINQIKQVVYYYDEKRKRKLLFKL